MTNTVMFHYIDLSFRITETECEEFFNNDNVQEAVDEISCYTQQLKNSQNNIFSRIQRIFKWQLMTAEKICI
jgi:hypothetical protein